MIADPSWPSTSTRLPTLIRKIGKLFSTINFARLGRAEGVEKHPRYLGSPTRLREYRLHRTSDEKYGSNRVGHSRQSTNPKLLGKGDGRPWARNTGKREKLRHSTSGDCGLCSRRWNNLQSGTLSQTQPFATRTGSRYPRGGSNWKSRLDFRTGRSRFEQQGYRALPVPDDDSGSSGLSVPQCSPGRCRLPIRALPRRN